MPGILSDKEFEAQDDMRTLKNAAEINSDAKRLKAAQNMADKEIKALNTISNGTLITGKKKKTLIS